MNNNNHHLELLKFYRNELQHEFNLLSTRVTWFVACQAFLVVPLVISMQYSTSSYNWLPRIVLPLLGVILALLVRPGLKAATETIDKWLNKQRILFAGLSDDDPIQDFSIDRDQQSVTEDSLHTSSLRFSSFIWIVFLIFWLLVGISQHLFPIIISKS